MVWKPLEEHKATLNGKYTCPARRYIKTETTNRCRKIVRHHLTGNDNILKVVKI